jgi:hypothetical protein
MQCPRCQAANRQGRRLGAECSAWRASPRLACLTASEPWEQCCGGRGMRLIVAPRPPEPNSRFPQSYTLSRLAENIPTFRSAHAGKCQQAHPIVCSSVAHEVQVAVSGGRTTVGHLNL